jgi:preprotein translocase subunit SecG
MTTFLIIIHVIVSIALIMIILLQTGKGADMGAAFGGGSSQTLFGSTGSSTFLSKATTVAAIVFMITSLGLAYISGNSTKSSIMMNEKAPIEQKAAPAAPEESPQPKAEMPQPAKPAQTK